MTTLKDIDFFNYMLIQADKIKDDGFKLEKATMEIFKKPKKIDKVFADKTDISKKKKRITINIAKDEENIEILGIFDYIK